MSTMNDALLLAISNIDTSRVMLKAIGERIINIIFEEEIKNYYDHYEYVNSGHAVLGTAPCQVPPHFTIRGKIAGTKIDATLPRLDIDDLLSNARVTAQAVSTVSFRFNIIDRFTAKITLPVSVLAGDEEFLAPYIRTQRKKFLEDMANIHDLNQRLRNINKEVEALQ